MSAAFSRISAVAALPILTGACSTLTDAGSFSVGGDDSSDRLCDRCPEDPALRHAPCPPADAAGEDHVVFFALRTLDFGSEAATWVDGFHAGMDQDCSARPQGFPVACTARTLEPTSTTLPHGVDNALAQTVLHPQADQPSFTLPAGLRESLEQGNGGALLVLDGWNRTPNDPHVGARLIASRGTSSGDPPRWDGTDTWTVYAAGWDPLLPGVPTTPYNVTSTAYVRDGTLVWDVRGEETLRFYAQSRRAVLRLDLRDGVFVGRLDSSSSPMKISDASFAGVWNLFDAQRQASTLAQLVGGCDPASWCSLEEELRAHLEEAPDMHLPGSSKGPSDTCDAISVGVAAELEETAGVQDFVSELPSSCEGNAAGCGE